MGDRYPSTDEEQNVHLDIAYPDARQDLNRWLPLVKWLLAILWGAKTSIKLLSSTSCRLRLL
jgi:hypothetical protein